ncbi:hypothetical protein NQZ79_g6117 [Umbelopsis isabellina]|nr:hypothetical protein NQZ79_g6117 [Umbelopsis isabellina]
MVGSGRNRVVLLPLDLASTRFESCEGSCKVPFALVSQQFLHVAWRTIYWISFCLTWAIIPMLQAYVNAGEFTVGAKLRYAVSINLKFYLVYAIVAVVGLVYLIIGNGYTTRDKLQGYVMAMANSWGLLLAIIFMGYGLVAVPRKLWFAANAKKELRHLYVRAPRVKEECMDSELEYAEVAKAIRKVDQKVKADDIHLRHAVDHILRRFPSVSEVTSRDTFRSVSIPRQLTEQYLVDLNQRMIKAARMRDRKLALWNNLIRDAFYLQDIVANQDSLDHHFYSTVRPLKEGTTMHDLKIRLEWWWAVRIKPVLTRTLAVVCAGIGICIIWSELTFNVRQPVLSIVEITLRACGLNYAAVEFMGHADLVPFLGTTFIDWFPVVILIPALTMLFNVQGRFLKLCGIPNIYEDDEGEGRHAEDEEGGLRGGHIVLNSEVDEGKALINEERRVREREVDPSSDNRAGGLLDRARNALGTYTAKYNREQPARAGNSHGHNSSSVRRDRDRHIDALLSGHTASGHRSPFLGSDSGSASPEDTTGELSDDSSNAFLRIKSRVGKGISEFWNKGTPPQNISPPSGSAIRGRAVEPETARSLPSSPRVGRELRSRSPSPNPWENVTSGGTSMVRGGSAAPTFNTRNTKRDNRKNIFDGI